MDVESGTAATRSGAGSPGGRGPKLLYVVGTGYTGSTLFGFLLNGHPQIATVGEATGPMASVEDQCGYFCSCGETLGECGFWKRVGEEMAERGFDFGPNRWDLRLALGESRLTKQFLSQSLRNNRLDALRDAAVLRWPTWRRRLHELARRNEAFAESVLAVSGRTVFLDISKDATRARYLQRLSRLDLHVIHLVRDSLGFVTSDMKNREVSLMSGVRVWTRTVGHADRLAALLPTDRFMRLRYEDLCTDMDASLSRVARFVGLEPHPGPVNFRDEEHHIIGNLMRLEDSSEVRLDELWRERLDRRQIDRILRWTGRQRDRLGYA